MARRPTKGITDLSGAPLGDIPSDMMKPAIRAQIEAAKAQIAAASATEEAANELKEVVKEQKETSKKEFRQKASKVGDKDIRINYPALSKLIKAAIAERDKGKDSKETAEQNTRLDEVAERVNIGNEKLTSLIAGQQVANRALGEILKTLVDIKKEGLNGGNNKSLVEDAIDAATGGIGGKGKPNATPNAKPSVMQRAGGLVRGAGNLLWKAKGGLAAVAGGAALDYAANKLTESGHEKLGAGASILSSIAGGAGLGMVGGPWGALAGGIAGGAAGLYQNWGQLTGGKPGQSADIKELEAKSKANQNGVSVNRGASVFPPTPTAPSLVPKSPTLLPSGGGLTTGGGGNSGGGGPANESQKQYYDKMYDALLIAAKEKGVANPEVVAKLGATQTALETGYGKHMVGNNAFGIKAGKNDTSVGASTQEFENGRMVTKNQNFKSYKNVTESAGDYIDFLQKNPRYKGVLAAKNIDEAISAQSKTGYATDPNYGAKLSSINSKMSAPAGTTSADAGPVSKTQAMTDKTGEAGDTKSRFATGTLAQFNMKDPSHIEGLQPDFATKLGSFLSAAQQAGHSIGIASGYRSPERQEQLFQEAVKKYGSEEAARKWVAPPGRSNHNKGLASDLSFSSAEAKSWAHQNASKFGLNFRMAHEPWHIEGGGGGGEPDSPAESASQVARAGPLSPARQTAMMERGTTIGGPMGARLGGPGGPGGMGGGPNLGMIGGMLGGALGGRSGGLFGSIAGGLLQGAMSQSGNKLARSSEADQMGQREPKRVMQQTQGGSGAGAPNVGKPTESDANQQNVVGNVEPVDAATRFRKLFGIAA